jgi:hypothetical protein
MTDREKLLAFADGVRRYAQQDEGHIVEFPDPPMLDTMWAFYSLESFMQLLMGWADELVKEEKLNG